MQNMLPFINHMKVVLLVKGNLTLSGEDSHGAWRTVMEQQTGHTTCPSGKKGGMFALTPTVLGGIKHGFETSEMFPGFFYFVFVFGTLFYRTEF